jgi:hypothetical protein
MKPFIENPQHVTVYIEGSNNKYITPHYLMLLKREKETPGTSVINLSLVVFS